MRKNRRGFLRDVGLGTASVLALPFSADNKQNDRRSESVRLGKEVEIDLVIENQFFLGIGSVRIQGTMMRDPSLPLFCEVRTPDGHQAVQFPIIRKTVTEEKIEIKLGVTTRTIPVMEYMLHAVRNRENLYGWSEEEKERPGTFLTLTILPLKRSVGSKQYTGFLYQYYYESPDLPIFKILDRGTWEIGGTSEGCENWMRVGHVPSIVAFEQNSPRYSTENYYHGIANPNVFQFLPLQTELQGFTFQANPKGILVTWPTQVSHVRSLVEKPAGQQKIFHFHQHCNDLSSTFTTAPMEVLWLENSDTTRVDRYNLYEEMRVTVHGHLHLGSGIKPERVSTYGMIEQWDEPDFDFYTDVILPQYIKLGIRRLFIPNEFQNAMNTWGLSNMCCNVDFKLPETLDPGKFKRFCDKANEAGILIDMWGNTAISTLTEMFQWRDGRQKGIRFLPEKGSITEVLKMSKEPFVRNPSHAIEADHYTPRFAVLNLRDDVIRKYWMQQWATIYTAGIRGIFLDSSFNMSSDKFHFIQNKNQQEQAANSTDYYRPEKPETSVILTQYHAHLQWIRQMQEIGFSYCGEDLGVFGVHRHGPDLNMFIDCMPIFTESFMDFDEKLALASGQDPLMIFFKGLAYRIMWMLRWDFSDKQIRSGLQDQRAYEFLNVFNKINDLMVSRTILPEETAVLYKSSHGPSSQMVYWVFKNTTLRFTKKMRVKNLMTGKGTISNVIRAEPLTVYLAT